MMMIGSGETRRFRWIREEEMEVASQRESGFREMMGMEEMEEMEGMMGMMGMMGMGGMGGMGGERRWWKKKKRMEEVDRGIESGDGWVERR